MSTEIQVDDETRAALLLFNERTEQMAAEERAAKRIAKAERAKDEAAAHVRKLGGDAKASADDKAEAEAAYKTAVEELSRIRENPDEPQRKPKPQESTEPAASEERSGTAIADDAGDEPAEVSADEEPDATVEASAESE